MSPRSLRAAFAPLLAVAGTLAAAPATARAATCMAAGGIATVQLSPGETANVRGSSGTLSINGVACAATADLDEVRLVGAPDAEEKVWLRLGGFTDVATIQWSVDLVTGRPDTIIISGTQAGSTIRAGSFADGTHGIDLDQNGEIDMLLTGVDKGRFLGGRGRDRFYGNLTAAAGALPFSGDLFMEGGAGNDLLVGGDGRDTIYGQEGDDDIRGRNGSDYLGDGPGDDIVDGGPGSEIMYCDPGTDTYLGGPDNELFITDEADADDLIDGGGGDDRIQYLRSNPVTVDLSLGVGGEAGESDTLVSIWGVYGGTGNDILIGDAQSNLLFGDEGDDILRGGGGVDELWCWTGTDSYSDASDLAHDCEILLPP